MQATCVRTITEYRITTAEQTTYKTLSPTHRLDIQTPRRLRPRPFGPGKTTIATGSASVVENSSLMARAVSSTAVLEEFAWLTLPHLR